MSKYKVLIADSRYGSYEEEKKVLQAIGAEVIIESSDNEDRLAELATDMDGIIVNLAPISEKVISKMTRCKCISRYGVGHDNVNAAALAAKGIALANVPDYCGDEVSDQAFALLMDCIRKISTKDRLIREGRWNLVDVQKIHRISGKTFGFVGFGMIPRFLFRKLSGFQLGKVLVYDPFIKDEIVKLTGVECADLNTLCKESDYISVHAPLTPATKGMIGAEQFGLMKPTAIVVNTSRGAVIDEKSLIDALKDRQIAGAGLDVFEQEPLPENSELKQLDNVVLTDHAGWYSEESISELKTKAALNIADTLLNGKPRYEVKI